MSHFILIDQHRQIHAATEKTPRPAHWAVLETRIRDNGGTPSTVTVTTFPTGFRVGRILSADNTTCSDPTDAHAPHLLRERRIQVVEWGRRETEPRLMLRGQLHAITNPIASSSVSPSPKRVDIWLALVWNTLCTAGNEELLEHASVWPEIEKTLKAGLVWFLANGNYTSWTENWTSLTGLVRAYSIDPDAGTNPGNARTITGVTSAQLSKGRSWAEKQIYNL